MPTGPDFEGVELFQAQLGQGIPRGAAVAGVVFGDVKDADVAGGFGR
jgi:hypothetical protein